MVRIQLDVLDHLLNLRNRGLFLVLGSLWYLLGSAVSTADLASSLYVVFAGAPVVLDSHSSGVA